MNSPIRILRSWLVLAVVAVAMLTLRSIAAEDSHQHDAAPAAEHAAHSDAAGHDSHGHGAVEEVGVFTIKQIAHSYLTAYMFVLSLCVGGLFLVLVHHLFDAAWSAPIRRLSETLASMLFVWMPLLVLPIVGFAWGKGIYAWFWIDPATDHALDVKKIMFNKWAFTIGVPALIFLLGRIAKNFLNYSLAQDKDGASKWTFKSRVQAGWGIFVFAPVVTVVCFYLMKSLQHQFFSTMYGVYYFAGSVWTTLITMYVLTVFLSRPGRPLEKVYFKRQQQDLGVLFFAFTVFYAYIHFSQYFLIWNASIPEETFWYVLRENGSWKWVGMTILFGHFFVPFLLLLNQDIKFNLAVMVPVAAWAWIMHYVDMTFNIMPVIHPKGLTMTIWDPLCWFGLVAFIGWRFWSEYQKYPPYPLRDPRLKEATTHHEVPAPGAAAAH